MTPMVLTLAVIGAYYFSRMVMRFIVWLDGADECEEDAPRGRNTVLRLDERP